MHHRQAFAENMNAGKIAAFKNRAAALAFEKGQPQKHVNFRAEPPSMSDELASQFEWRIGDDGLDADRLDGFHKEIPAGMAIGAIVFDKISRVHDATRRAQCAHDSAGAASWLPYRHRHAFDSEECPDGFLWRLVKVIAAFRERSTMIAGAARHACHYATSPGLAKRVFGLA